MYDANCHLKGTIEREDGFFMCTDHIPEVIRRIRPAPMQPLTRLEGELYLTHLCFVPCDCVVGVPGAR